MVWIDARNPVPGPVLPRVRCAILCGVKRPRQARSAQSSLAVLLAVAAALLAAGSLPASEHGYVEYAPHAEARDAPELRGSTWHREGETYALRLQRIDDAQRQAYIRARTGLATDPFANRPEARPRFLSFLLEIENRGDGAIHMNPGHCWLMTNRKKIETPMGLTDLSFAYKVAGASLPPAYEKVGPLLLDHPVVVPAGESAHGLLIYRNFDSKTRSYHVDVQLTLPDGDLVRFAAPYRRVKAGATERKP